MLFRKKMDIITDNEDRVIRVTRGKEKLINVYNEEGQLIRKIIHIMKNDEEIKEINSIILTYYDDGKIHSIKINDMPYITYEYRETKDIKLQLSHNGINVTLKIIDNTFNTNAVLIHTMIDTEALPLVGSMANFHVLDSELYKFCKGIWCSTGLDIKFYNDQLVDILRSITSLNMISGVSIKNKKLEECRQVLVYCNDSKVGKASGTIHDIIEKNRLI